MRKNDKIMKRGKMTIERQNGQKMTYFRTQLQISINIRKANRIITKRVLLNCRNTFFFNAEKAPKTPNTREMARF